jgi:hypothetical protein
LRVRRPAHTALTLAVLWASVGCSGKGNVSGKVTYHGQPLPGGTVAFAPEAGGPGNSAQIDPKDGTYHVGRLPAGPMKITVTPLKAGGSGIAEVPGGRMPGGPPPGAQGMPPDMFKRAFENPEGTEVEIPIKYTTLEGTDLRYTVKSGDQEFNIELKD